MASFSGGGGGAPSDLDISLQGPAVSRQLKELVFTRQVTEIEAYEKEKEVKSFVAPGQPLMTADVEAALLMRAQPSRTRRAAPKSTWRAGGARSTRRRSACRSRSPKCRARRRRRRRLTST